MERMVKVFKDVRGVTEGDEARCYTIPTIKPYTLKNRKEMVAVEGMFFYENENYTKSEVFVPFWDLTISDFVDYFPESERQAIGKENILTAIKRKGVIGVWLTRYEISVDEETGEVQSITGKKPAVGRNFYDAEKLAKQYDPENNSYMLNVDEYLLIIARAIKDRFLTWEQAFEDSKEVGNYRNSSKSPKGMEETGGNVIIGISNIIGNTCKIIKSVTRDEGFSLAGGNYGNLGHYSAGYIKRVIFPDINNYRAVALVALKG